MKLFLKICASRPSRFLLAASTLIAGIPVSAQEQARSADSFVDSVGINGFGPDDDASAFDRVHSLGIRHVRASLQAMDPTHAALVNHAYSQ